MDKAKFLALLTALGFGAGAGVTVAIKSLPDGSKEATIIHALRIQAARELDGGLGEDTVTVWRTKVTASKDGGVQLEDKGPAACTGDTKAIRTAVSACKGMVTVGVGKNAKSETVDLENLRVIEVRSKPPDAGMVAVEVYGSNGAANCELPKTEAFRTAVSSLKCEDIKPVITTVNPL